MRKSEEWEKTLETSRVFLFVFRKELMNSKVQAHKEICEYLTALYEAKNHDYGDSFHQSFIEEGMAMTRIRLGDKFSRLKALTLNGDQQVKDESVRDTLLDLPTMPS